MSDASFTQNNCWGATEQGSESSSKDREEENIVLMDWEKCVKEEKENWEKERQTEQMSSGSSWLTDEPSRSHRSLVYIHQSSHS